jgi:hypothetical protein
VDLHHIRHSCVVSAGNEWAAESWSLPIFILSQRLLGGLQADEDVPPADESTPHPIPHVPFAHAGEAAVEVTVQQAPHDWTLWLHGQHQAQDLAADRVVIAGQNLGFTGDGFDGPPDLNDVPHNIDIDLNAHPQQLNEEDSLELNDFIFHVIHNHPQDQVIFALTAPNAPMQKPEDVDMVQPEEIHSDITITISSANTLAHEYGDSVNGTPHQQHQHLHLRMALIPDTHVDPVASLSPRYGPYKASFFYSREGTAWSSHFKPGGSIVNKVTVPARWADFFTAKILTPEDFDWAKNLLQSRIW